MDYGQSPKFFTEGVGNTMPDQKPLSAAENLNTNTWESHDTETNGVQTGAEKPLETTEQPKQPETGPTTRTTLNPEILAPKDKDASLGSEWVDGGKNFALESKDTNLGGKGLNRKAIKQIDAAMGQLYKGTILPFDFTGGFRNGSQAMNIRTWGNDSAWKNEEAA